MKNHFKQGVCRVGKVIPADDPLIERVPEWQRDWRTGFNQMVEAGAIVKCDTIEELEEALGLRPSVLTDAVPSWLIPLKNPPYYGAKLGGNIFTTKCGLKVNPRMQVLDTTGAVIPGLYAGWHTAGGANGETNIGGRPFGGMYGDVGQSFVGGYMAAGG
ncbi:MAG: FAD-binding protein, partial [Raoultibacter sp.]